jgi:hypothetical protein
VYPIIYDKKETKEMSENEMQERRKEKKKEKDVKLAYCAMKPNKNSKSK